MRSHWTEKMKIKDFLQYFWKESRSKKRGQSVKYAACPRLHYAVCVMQINGLFLWIYGDSHNSFRLYFQFNIVRKFSPGINI